jgi:uncharacterized membrane protein
MPYNGMMDWYPYMEFWTSIIWMIIIIAIAYLIYRLIKSEKIIALAPVSE